MNSKFTFLRLLADEWSNQLHYSLTWLIIVILGRASRDAGQFAQPVQYAHSEAKQQGMHVN